MNIGIISIRYARALYSLAFDQGMEDIVYNEMKCMLQQFLTFPELKHHITSPIVPSAKKKEILQLCAGGDNISLITKKFIDFVVKRDKQEIIQFMCVAYKIVYRKEKNILSTKFISASEPDKALLDKICSKIEDAYSAKVELETKVDKKLIGGFIIDVNNYRMDASVSGELNRMKIAFLNKENSIN